MKNLVLLVLLITVSLFAISQQKGKSGFALHYDPDTQPTNRMQYFKPGGNLFVSLFIMTGLTIYTIKWM